MNNIKPLDEIIQEFEDLRANFKVFSKNSDDNRESLLEYQHRFIDLKADLRYWHKKVAGEYTRRDEKACTGIKYRIAVAISEGNFKDEEGKLIYDKCSISQAEKLAAGSEKYKEFLSQRAFYKESLINIADLREDIANYVLIINNRLKYNSSF